MASVVCAGTTAQPQLCYAAAGSFACLFLQQSGVVEKEGTKQSHIGRQQPAKLVKACAAGLAAAAVVRHALQVQQAMACSADDIQMPGG